MNATYAGEHYEGHHDETNSNSEPLEFQKFYAMTDEEHKAAGHFKDSTNSWIDPNNYISTYYMDW